MVKIGDVYNMGSYFVPSMIKQVKRVISAYGSGFGVVGFEGSDMKEFLLWVLENSKVGLYNPIGLYIKQPYVGYYNENDNVWLNIWRLSFHASPLGLGGLPPISQTLDMYPFYRLSLLNGMENIMKRSNITDLNLLSILEKKIYQQKVDVIVSLDKQDIYKIESTVCMLYGDSMIDSLSTIKKRKFTAIAKEICDVE